MCKVRLVGFTPSALFHPLLLPAGARKDGEIRGGTRPICPEDVACVMTASRLEVADPRTWWRRGAGAGRRTQREAGLGLDGNCIVKLLFRWRHAGHAPRSTETGSLQGWAARLACGADGISGELSFLRDQPSLASVFPDRDGHPSICPLTSFPPPILPAVLGRSRNRSGHNSRLLEAFAADINSWAEGPDRDRGSGCRGGAGSADTKARATSLLTPYSAYFPSLPLPDLLHPFSLSLTHFTSPSSTNFCVRVVYRLTPSSNSLLCWFVCV